MKRSEKAHARIAAQFGIFDSSKIAGYYNATKLWGTVFNLVDVVEARYTTARVAVPGCSYGFRTP
jgi:hypothetical protein